MKERNSIFTQESADALRARYDPRVHTHRRLAHEYQCSIETIGKILRGESWTGGRKMKVLETETQEYKARVAASIAETLRLLAEAEAADKAGIRETSVPTMRRLDPDMPVDPKIQAKADFFTGKITREERDRIINAGEMPDFDTFLGGNTTER